MSLIHEALKKAEAQARQENYTPPPLDTPKAPKRRTEPARPKAAAPARPRPAIPDAPRPRPAEPKTTSAVTRRAAMAAVSIVAAAGVVFLWTTIGPTGRRPQSSSASQRSLQFDQPIARTPNRQQPRIEEPITPATPRGNVIVEPIDPEELYRLEQPIAQDPQPRPSGPQWLTAEAIEARAEAARGRVLAAADLLSQGCIWAKDNTRRAVLIAAQHARYQRDLTRQRIAAVEAERLAETRRQAQLAAQQQLEAARQELARRRAEEQAREKAEAIRLAAERQRIEQEGRDRAEAQRLAYEKQQAEIAESQKAEAQRLQQLRQKQQAAQATVASVEPESTGSTDLAGKFELNGILFSYDGIAAVINNKPYGLNETVDGAKVVHIERTMVKLQYKGQTITLRL
ncbi:MAG: hypothetical protein ACLFUJ_03735 [Phycisphaerae bacterium]